MNIYICIFAMALTTYLIRMLPLTLFQKKIKNRFLRSFLTYVPCACLTAMTFPSILYSTNSLISGLIGFLVAIIVSFLGKSLVMVAACSCAAVFLTEQILCFF
ncbi:MAG: AzlD domain-containing protein [Clostridiales bacterium]|nr:AzlD domain-containing protein [Clostridiales bacterium]MCI1960978.1 AzlD domain-containing protein [Clostridiales bacterium]MCI2021419.1 AzlD domain-containing protein [Clostridiales bacterium]MCI2026205.1 AzlD domain-containing protein [Clostridiales bacterium]